MKESKIEESRRHFWREVFLMAFRKDKSDFDKIGKCVAYADEALSVYDKKFGLVSEECLTK